MSDFVSWITITREDGSGKDVFFLTDKEIFSPHGKEVFGGCRDSDFKGHGAIRKFYDIPSKRGATHEVPDFWNTKKLPPEIAELIPELEKHWGRIIKCGAFSNGDLFWIICNTTDEKYKALAWRQVLKQKPSSEEWRCFICNTTDEKYQALAWKRFLEQKPSNETLLKIVFAGSVKYSAKARKILKLRK